LIFEKEATKHCVAMDKEFGNQAIFKMLQESGVSYVVGHKNHGVFSDNDSPTKTGTWVAKTNKQELAWMFYDSAVCCFLGNADSCEAVSDKVT
jgi:hypothetical protein